MGGGGGTVQLHHATKSTGLKAWSVGDAGKPA